MDTLSWGEVKARKEHRCNYCGGKINKGEVYLTSTHVEDGIYTWKSHIHCDKLCDLLDMDKYDGIDADSFAEYLEEYFRYEIPLSKKAKLAFDKLNNNT